MPLLAGYCRDNGPRPAVIAMFSEINPLPCAEKQPAVADGYCQTAPEQHRFEVSRHVVAAFQSMFVVMRAVGNEFTKVPLEVAAHFGAHVLVNDDRSRRVLDEKVQYAGLDLAQLRELRHDFSDDHVKTSSAGLEPDDPLNPSHDEIMQGTPRAERTRKFLPRGVYECSDCVVGRRKTPILGKRSFDDSGNGGHCDGNRRSRGW